MIVLSATTQTVEVLLGGASVAPLPIVSSCRTVTPTDSDASMVLVNSNGATAVTAVAAPASGNRSLVDLLQVYNPNTAAAVVTVRVNQSGSFFILAKVTLAQDERLEYADGSGWRVLNSAGALKTSVNQGNNVVAGAANATVLGSDVVNNNAVANSIADVTGLSFPVVAGLRYWFKFRIYYTAAATTTGSRWCLNGPATTSLAINSRYCLTATSETVNNVTGYDLPATSNTSSASTTNNLATIEGFIIPSADGTVIARFASEIANSAITAKAGSKVEWGVV